MSLLSREQIKARLNSGKPDQLFIDPLLSDEQLGAVSIDLRLGCDFLVSVQTRKASVSLLKDEFFREPSMFFQESRRDVGETFILYPSQTALSTTLEYIGLPNNVYSDVTTRSSYNRLGLTLNSTFQPGFRGCVSLELFNHSNSPIELVVGSRIVQARFFGVEEDSQYFTAKQRRKYIGHVRPTTSRAADDSDLAVLSRMAKEKL
ncbi:dCTP deaminase [Sulfitobacter sp. PS-8MA]|uniref:dCTP deaminase n=1 Tax=Sulfitobacter sp. PS-8MA TaxID=3237707 RepID=UPI0034C649D8